VWALGEFGLIARLTTGLETRPDVLLAAGDDAALLDLCGTGGDQVLVATCDAQVEGRHFLRGIASPEEIGHKALAVNLSDVAAMGAEPRWVLVSLLLPPDLDVALLDGVYAGMRALARRYGVSIVGGNIAATDGPLTLDLTLLGAVERGRALTRSGGRPGDTLLVTGALGAAAAGVLAATGPGGAVALPDDVRERVRAAMAAPEPRLREGQALAALGTVGALLDVSDGLAADLGHLCDASGVGAVVEAERVPIAPDAVAVSSAIGRDPLELALMGGEDYELLFSVRPDAVAAAIEAVRTAGGQATVIGHLTDAAQDRSLRFADGAVRPLPRLGWDHLRSDASTPV
jgi:thiamine-monophosphate kinase